MICHHTSSPSLLRHAEVAEWKGDGQPAHSLQITLHLWHPRRMPESWLMFEKLNSSTSLHRLNIINTVLRTVLLISLFFPNPKPLVGGVELSSDSNMGYAFFHDSLSPILRYIQIHQFGLLLTDPFSSSPCPGLSIRIMSWSAQTKVFDTFPSSVKAILIQAVSRVSSSEIRFLALVLRLKSWLMVSSLFRPKPCYNARCLAASPPSWYPLDLVPVLLLLPTQPKTSIHLTMKIRSLIWAILPGLAASAGVRTFVRAQISKSLINISFHSLVSSLVDQQQMLYSQWQTALSWYDLGSGKRVRCNPIRHHHSRIPPPKQKTRNLDAQVGTNRLSSSQRTLGS